jgi:hypothetical protein
MTKLNVACNKATKRRLVLRIEKEKEKKLCSRLNPWAMESFEEWWRYSCSKKKDIEDG